MTTVPSIDPARFLDEQLSQASADQHVHRHQSSTFADLEHQGVGCDERERSGVLEPAGAEVKGPVGRKQPGA